MTLASSNNHGRELEICAETLQACVAASDGGADRIELCAALNEGGVTPSLGLLREAVASVRIPMHVLMRPRTGNFIYSEAEVRAMCRDVEGALNAGAAGVVIGALTAECCIDEAQSRMLLRAAGERPVTFHRAFDHVADQQESLRLLIDLGIARVLTSGGMPNVTEGFDSLVRLADQADGRIRIAAGGGVTLQNAPRLLKVPGLDLHASMRRKVAAGDDPASDPLWHPCAEEVSMESVRSLAALVHSSPAVSS